MAITLDAASTLSLTIVRVMKLFHGTRQHAPRYHPGLDAGAYPVLFNLATGPKRVSELAECVHSDISTVSRQASTLVALGIAKKVTDPSDGRAQVITITDEESPSSSSSRTSARAGSRPCSRTGRRRTSPASRHTSTALAGPSRPRAPGPWPGQHHPDHSQEN